MDGWKVFAVILSVLGILLLVTEPYRIRNKQLAKKIRNNVEMLKEFDSDFKTDGSFTNYNKKISFNESKKIFKIYKRNEHNEIVSTASRGKQTSGAAIGGVFAGGVGAIIGGLSSGSKQVTIIKLITMKITVDDFKNPVHYIDFLPIHDSPGYNPVGYKKDSDIIKTALKKADYWQGVMDLAIRKANQVAH